MAPVTRQEIQGVVEVAKNRILERMISKNDIQTLAEHIRGTVLQTMQTWQNANQQHIRQTAIMDNHLWQKTASIEIRMTSLEHQMKVLQQLITRVLEQQPKVRAE